jgi:lysophospholipase L1-like esterase
MSPNSGPTGSLAFGGYYATQGTKSLRTTSRAIQMEFIGDSHNVGYANRPTKTQCTQDEILDSTDSSLAPGPLVANYFKADYQINALSGRGVVRNFDGFGGATLPQAYPYAVFGSERPYVDRSWRPQVIAISLGTNDFAMPLHANEPWQGADALRSDYVASYVRFVKGLRARSPTALMVIWAIDWKLVPASVPAGQQVVAQLNAEGDDRVGFLEIRNLAMGACNFHPTAEDDRTIADSLIAYFENHQRAVATSR